MSRYLVALKEQNFRTPALRVLQKLQKDPSYSYCGTQVSSSRKYQEVEALPNGAPSRTDAVELRALVAMVYANEDDRAEALAVAIAGPEAALTCYRALATNLAPNEQSREKYARARDRRSAHLCRVRKPDERRTLPCRCTWRVVLRREPEVFTRARRAEAMRRVSTQGRRGRSTHGGAALALSHKGVKRWADWIS